MYKRQPLIKVERTKNYGAEVVLYGDVYDEACEYALKLADEKGYTFIHPFDDLTVATGQGTIAMEIFQELPLVDYILVPVGGGGLATGVSTLAKLLNPKIKVIGVEPVSYTHLADSLDLFQIIMGIEEEFDIEISTKVVEKIVSVGDAVEQIKLAIG